jgi:hypothetical protein
MMKTDRRTKWTSGRSFSSKNVHYDEPWVKTTFGDEDAVEGDDEHEDNDGNVHEEVPNDPDIHI